MSLRENEPVIVVVTRIFRVIPHVPEEKGSRDVCGRQTGRRMATARSGGGSDRMDPQLVGYRGQSFSSRIHHFKFPFNLCPNQRKEKPIRQYVDVRSWPVRCVKISCRTRTPGRMGTKPQRVLPVNFDNCPKHFESLKGGGAFGTTQLRTRIARPSNDLKRHINDFDVGGTSYASPY